MAGSKVKFKYFYILIEIEVNHFSPLKIVLNLEKSVEKYAKKMENIMFG